MSGPHTFDIPGIAERLRQSGDSEAADALEKTHADLLASEKANEDLEARNTFLIEEIERAIEAAKTAERKP